MTSYIILKKIDDRNRDANAVYGDWLQGPTVEAVSAEAAVRKALSDSDKGGTFVAVPLRSFSEQVVSVETKRTVKFA